MTNAIKKHKWGIIAVIISILIYLQIYAYDPVWDDGYFLDWEKFQSITYLGNWLTGDTPVSLGNVYRPLRSIWFFLGIQTWDRWWTGYHMQGILTYAILIWYTYLTSKVLFKSSLWAGVAALLYGIYPLHVPSVAWITGNMELIGLLGWWIALYTYVSYFHNFSHKKPQTQLPAKQLKILTFATICAFFTYELTLTLIPIIIWYELIWHNSSTRLIWKRTRRLWLIAASFILFRVLFVKGYEWNYLFENFFVNVFFVIQLTGEFITMMLWPFNNTANNTLANGITSFYSLEKTFVAPPIFNNLQVWLYILLTSAWGATTYTCWWLLKRSTNPTSREQDLLRVCLFLGISILGLLPVVYLIPVSMIKADRYTFIASYGIIGLIVTLGQIMSIKLSKIAAVVVLVIITTFYAYNTWRFTLTWQNTVTFWLRVTQTTPQSSYAWKNLAGSYVSMHDIPAAVEPMKRTVELRPGDIDSLVRLIWLYQQVGDQTNAKATQQTLQLILKEHGATQQQIDQLIPQ